MNLANNLKKIRKEQGLSQEELADKLNVSRQSVSKWESGTAYPEMDKVIQLCKLFNVNIDELLNQDIKEVNNTKQSKNNINTIINSILEYITKTIDMFSSMKFKEKVKCFFEQAVIVCILSLLLSIIGAVLTSAFNGITNLFPYNISIVIKNLFNSIYILFAVLFGVILLLHIFKTRYLDYYEIVNKEETSNNESNIKDENSDDKKRIILEKKQEKIIIRDPNHTGYKFISSLFRILLFFVKIFALFIGAFFSMTLLCLVICFVLSFIIIKSGLPFIGTILAICALVTINLIILNIIYNIIVSHRNRKNILAIGFVLSLIIGGVGIGIVTISLKDFEIIHLSDDNHFVEKIDTIPMTKGLFINDCCSTINYVENDSNTIKISMKSSKYYRISIFNNDYNGIHFNLLYQDKKANLLKSYIEDINNHKIVDYTDYSITIYTSKENIATLKDNRENYYKEQEERKY